ncbi:MAG: prepilin-type N-terminal cleavage/methylation domain-containing protein [Planctomycetes bacterium]|nr:prepilin-type N-terminal cleavage/methylation domain-containing protein [Planctomycetota bacterium]
MDRKYEGFTLIEQMVAAAVLAVATLGTLGYQYHAATMGRIARGQIGAARAAHLLLVDWKSTGGSKEYDPAGLGLGFSERGAVPAGFTTPAGLGTTLNDMVYGITLDGLPMLAALKYQDVDKDTQTQTTLRQLAVILRFAQVNPDGSMSTPESRFVDLPPVTMVTYVRLDGSDG